MNLYGMCFVIICARRGIDIVALADKSNIFFCEMKWKDMIEAEVLRLVGQLKEKYEHVH